MATHSDQIATRQKRVLVITAALLGLIIVIWLGVEAQHVATSYSDGTLKLTVVPNDAKIVIDHKTTVSSPTISLTPGTHTITLSRPDFTTKSITVTATAHHTTSQTVVLGIANLDSAAQYYANHPNQATVDDAIGQQQVEQNGQIISQNNPLINILPYHGANYDIDFGVSRAHPNDLDAVAIYITADTQAGQTNALNWIRAQGYDPSAYEIIYQTTAQAASGQ